MPLNVNLRRPLPLRMREQDSFTESLQQTTVGLAEDRGKRRRLTHVLRQRHAPGPEGGRRPAVAVGNGLLQKLPEGFLLGRALLWPWRRPPLNNTHNMLVHFQLARIRGRRCAAELRTKS